jgi:hypothetical protein
VGPLAVRWLAYDLPALRAGERGRARVELENAGLATWRSRGEHGVQLAYHWLDPLGNPIVWDGTRTPLAAPVAPGERVALPLELEAPAPAGEYRLAVDLVHEFRFWFEELGNEPLAIPVDVEPRIAARSLAVRIGPGDDALAAATRAALAEQEEPVAADPDAAEAVAYLAPGCLPAPDWSRRLLDAHAEGFAAVAGSVEPEDRGRRRTLAAWAPGFGRVPGWTQALLCPSLLVPAPLTELEGLPALDPAAISGRVLCDGRIRVRVRGRR